MRLLVIERRHADATRPTTNECLVAIQTLPLSRAQQQAKEWMRQFPANRPAANPAEIKVDKVPKEACG